MLFLEEPFKSAWCGKDAFLEVSIISNRAASRDVYRNKEGRKTLRFNIGGNSCFLKYHRGVGWKEILKNLLQFRLPVLGARNEYEAAIKLQALGVDTLKPLAFGERGNNPARQESFLITEDLANTVSLENYCRNWSASPAFFRTKKSLIEKLANCARLMHGHGINHRDFYLCHFLLEKNAEQKILKGEDFHCYLIDLHRCQMRQKVPYRWQVKDLGGLLYSALDTGLTRRDGYRFIKIYSGLPLRSALQNPLWQTALQNANWLYRKDFRKEPPRIFDGS